MVDVIRVGRGPPGHEGERNGQGAAALWITKHLLPRAIAEVTCSSSMELKFPRRREGQDEKMTTNKISEASSCYQVSN